ncbi:MAG: hypothetical protein ACI8RZ_007561, partial [Myxococcota bacterium]
TTHTSPARALSAGPGSEVILGLPSLTDVTVEVVAEHNGVTSRSAMQSATTGALPDDLPQPTLGTWLEGDTASEDYVLGSFDADAGEAYSGPYWLFILDRMGRIVWYHPVEEGRMSMFPRLARDGSHIAYDNRNDFFGELEGNPSTVRRMTLDGTWSTDVLTPGMGWTWDELPDSTVLYDRNQATPDVTIQEVAPDGTQTTLWDCGAWMAEYDDDKENCYTNTVNYSPQTDSIWWSTYWGDYIVEVDRSGEVLRHIGARPDSWTIEPAEAGIELQHYPNFTPTGTLILSTHIPGDETEQQRAWEYEIDDEAKTFTAVWGYGEGEDAWAEYSGEAVRLEGGSTLINYGTGGEIREVSLAGELLWQVSWGEDYTLGHTQLIGDLYALNVGG